MVRSVSIPPTIKLLNSDTINKIAAGEVVDRPSSVIKELFENAVDAGATEITIRMENGGQNLISVTDNGCGMSQESLNLAVERHATSKLVENDISNILYFGFRGEALPSIGSVSKLIIKSMPSGSDRAFKIEVNGGIKSPITATSGNLGTSVEVRDLFSFTPARLKFLKSTTSEKAAAIDLIERFAMAHPSVAMSFFYDDKKVLSFLAGESLEQRLSKIMGEKFINHSVQLEAASQNIKITGYAALPTFNHSTTAHQYFFVNGRSIRDKLLFAATKAAYQGLIPTGRSPAVVIFIELDPYDVDVNVHPTKAEVRFKEADAVRNLIISHIRKALRDAEFKKNATPSLVAAQAPSHLNVAIDHKSPPQSFVSSTPYPKTKSIPSSYQSPTYNPYKPSSFKSIDPIAETANKPVAKGTFEFNQTLPQKQLVVPEVKSHPLGYAKFQIANKFIVAENDEGLILVDQHAAHERITLEQFKAALKGTKLPSQMLAIPQIVSLGQKLSELILSSADKLANMGLLIEKFGDDSIAIRTVPAELANCDMNELLRDSANELLEIGEQSSIEDQLLLILSNHACHHSIRSGRKMTLEEMNHLLRQIEAADYTGQCNHGRPTYKKISLKELEKMFERS